MFKSSTNKMIFLPGGAPEK